ncbi:MAG: hypothetical protein BV458_13770 [Thermoplasmata archaeon M9B2D]|nr:MAG: hypothetical protein BV458_13770 [Thermoplasmata archaeon M9B2D]
MDATMTKGETKMAIGSIIYNQIGKSAFAMMGASNIMITKNGLQWKVGKNSKKVTHVTVTLEASDTYTVKFQKVGRSPSFKVTDIATAEDVYVENLHQVIQDNTGLYLSL